MRSIGWVLILLLSLALDPPAGAETTFRLVVQKRGQDAAQGVGVLVAKELLVTSAGLVGQGDQFLVHVPLTKARLAATVKASEPDADLALLSVPGLHGEPARLALEASGVGRKVLLAAPGGSPREGTLHSVAEDPQGRVRYRSTLLPAAHEAAAPLLNNCGEVLAIHQLAPSRAARENEHLGTTGGLPALKHFLQEQQVEPQVAPAACPSLQDQLAQAQESRKALEEEKAALEAEQQEAEDEKTALEQELQELGQAAGQNEQQAQELEARKAELEKRLRTQANQLAAKQSELEAQAKSREELEAQIVAQQEESRLQGEENARRQQEQEETLRLALIAGACGVAMLLGVALLAWRKARKDKAAKDQAEQELERELEEKKELEEAIGRAAATHPDALLSGTGPGEQRIQVKINGNALIRAANGQVIGRSGSNAAYTVPVDTVSREHARLRVVGESVTIEDLGSTNGTSLNGIALPPGEVRTVEDGSTVGLADVELVFRYTQAS